MTNPHKPNGLRPDIVIGLVGAAGTDLAPVKQQLKAQFASFDYDYQEIKLSELIGGFCTIATDDLAEDERIKALMDGGDRIRAARGAGDGVICLAVTAIRKVRGDRPDSGPGHKPYVYVIDSLKNPKEVQTLELVYGRNFYTISVYSSFDDRKTRLANRIAETCVTNVRDEHRSRAEHVISEDENRGRTGVTQDVRGTFPRGDFFIAANGETEVHVKRFVGLIFGEPFITPTLDEYAIYLAKAAAFRSCDLSRQVGAVIIDERGAIVSTRCNDVPYPGGGMYFEGRAGVDNRDYTVEFDPNSAEISNIFSELVSAFRQAQILDPQTLDQSDAEIVAGLLHGKWKELTIDARVRNLIEFGRVVHAEMHALSDAARLGRPVQGASLYCTTFPCHICARHIIASGVRRVIFIEPYPKSLTKTLYKREIISDEVHGDLPNPVSFEAFQGVSPKIYQSVFAYRQRKTKTGTIVHLDRSSAVPVDASLSVANPALEETLSSAVDGMRIKLSEQSTDKEGTTHAK